MTTRPDDKLSLGDAAYKRLRDDITWSRLAPGARITERQLSEATGFGASPIRAALTRLDHEGLVITEPRKGYRVSALTIRSIENMFEIWSLVGPEMFRRGLLRATDSQHAELIAVAARAERIASSRPVDVTLLLQQYATYTQLLAQATGNDYMVSLLDRLSCDIARVWTLVLEHDSTTSSMAQHGAIARNVVETRDADATAELARQTIAAFHERVLALVRELPSVLDAEIAGPQVAVS